VQRQEIHQQEVIKPCDRLVKSIRENLSEIKAVIKLMHYGKDGCITKKICFFIMIKWLTCCLWCSGEEQHLKRLVDIQLSGNPAIVHDRGRNADRDTDTVWTRKTLKVKGLHDQSENVKPFWCLRVSSPKNYTLTLKPSEINDVLLSDEYNQRVTLKNILALPRFIIAVNGRFCFEVHKSASVHHKSASIIIKVHLSS